MIRLVKYANSSNKCIASRCSTMHCLALPIGAELRYRYTDPRLRVKPCTLVRLRSRSRHTVHSYALHHSKALCVALEARPLTVSHHVKLHQVRFAPKVDTRHSSGQQQKQDSACGVQGILLPLHSS